MMKIKPWKYTAAALLMMSVLLGDGSQISQAASKYVELELHWEDGRTKHIETLFKEGVTYGNYFTMGSHAGLRWGMEGDNTAVRY